MENQSKSKVKTSFFSKNLIPTIIAALILITLPIVIYFLSKTINLKTYTNPKYLFSFSYPNYLTVEVSNDRKQQFLLKLKGENEEYAFNIQPGETHEYTTSTRTETINNLSWKVIPTGNYCDAGQCFDTAASYKYFKEEVCNDRNDLYYNFPSPPRPQFPKCGFTYELLLYKPIESTVKTILSSFRFTQ